MTDFAKEYGDGLFALAMEEGKSREWLDQLTMLESVLGENPDFVRLLSNMSLSGNERKQIISRVLDNQVDPMLVNFLKILCDRGALSELRGCIAAYRADYDAENRVVEAVVTTAAPFDERQRKALTARVRELTGGREIRLKERLDPAVIGGVMLEANGQRWDSTVRSRLEDMRRTLAGN